MRTLPIAAAMLLWAVPVWAQSVVGMPAPEPGIENAGSPGSVDWESVSLEGASGKLIAATLGSMARPEIEAVTRGRKEIELYRNAAPAVVLIVSDSGAGSGIHIGSGRIITNWHVVGSKKVAAVVFKPQAEGAGLNAASVVRAEVVKTDSVKDLALLQATSVPQHARTIEPGADADIQVGADVHAIGHPTGETWTYTRGLISQVRLDYQWKTESSTHRANVIQTQTPINPGNSGGPLLSDSGKLLGVNSFKAAGEGLNFAVSVRDVLSFLSAPQGPPSGSAGAACRPTTVFDGRDRDNKGRLVRVDTNCDGKPDASFWYPDDPSKPYQILFDTNGDGKADVVIEDTDRDGRWDVSYHDVDHDGRIDLVGYHPDGKVKPSRFERYAQR